MIINTPSALAIVLSMSCLYTGSIEASGEYPFSINATSDKTEDVLLPSDIVKKDDITPLNFSTEEFNLLDSDMKVNLTYTSTPPGSWRVTARWGKSKSAERTVQAPAGYEFCRAKTHQRGNKGGLSMVKPKARSVTFLLNTSGGSFFDRWIGWQEGWYDITWISDNANATHRYAHSCL